MSKADSPSNTARRAGSPTRAVARPARKPYQPPRVGRSTRFESVALACAFAPEEGACGAGAFS